MVSVQRQIILMVRIIWQSDLLGYKPQNIMTSSRPKADPKVPVLLLLGAHLSVSSSCIAGTKLICQYLHDLQVIYPAFSYSHKSNFSRVLAISRHYHTNPTFRTVSLGAPSSKFHCSSTSGYTVVFLEEQECVKHIHGEFERKWL